MRICVATGLRIDDVLSLRTDDIQSQRFSITEKKTGKRKRVYLPLDLWRRALAQSGRYFVFEHRTDPCKHKTRQAVWADVKRAQKAFRLDENIAPHSARKIYAVAKFNRYGDITEVQKLLNHDNREVTLLYAMADILTARRYKKRI